MSYHKMAHTVVFIAIKNHGMKKRTTWNLECINFCLFVTHWHIKFPTRNWLKSRHASFFGMLSIRHIGSSNNKASRRLSQSIRAPVWSSQPTPLLTILQPARALAVAGRLLGVGGVGGCHCDAGHMPGGWLLYHLLEVGMNASALLEEKRGGCNLR